MCVGKTLLPTYLLLPYVSLRYAADDGSCDGGDGSSGGGDVVVVVVVVAYARLTG